MPDPGMASINQMNLQIPNTQYWQEQIKCQSACPVNTDARGYVRAIADGNDELAYLIARGPNPLASICGRVCGAPCEQACRRGDLDEPVSIRALKRYVCEQFGAEARSQEGKKLVDFLMESAQKYAPRQCQGKNELLPLLQSLTKGEIQPVEGKSVGIIGSGPAGLAAAHDLALLGFDVTLYEMEPVLAGMLAVGVPEYRLPRAVIQAEVDVILSLGVQSQTNCCIGKDLSFADLRRQHDAVVIAVGAKQSRHLPIPGSDAKGILGGVEFLRDVSLHRPPPLGKRVVVIGGGNVAYDVGRSVLRQISMDAARSARRSPGVGEVYLCSLESLEEMPADDIEILEGDEEGIIRKNSLGPQAFLKDDAGHVRGVVFNKCLRVFDEQKRFNPLFDENETIEIECDHVLVSIGQQYDVSFIDPEKEGIDLNPNGTIRCDPESGATNVPDVFVAGDLAYGTKLLIHAVASGKAVARTIYQQFTGRRIQPQDTELHFPDPYYMREDGYEKQERISPVTLSPQERITSQSSLVEYPFSTEQARGEAGRCLDCGVNTIFNGDRCILCGGCVDVCPQQCLQIVSLASLMSQEKTDTHVLEQLGGFSYEDASSIIKDETVCIRCALCAERCPVGAITMERFYFKEVLTCQAV